MFARQVGVAVLFRKGRSHRKQPAGEQCSPLQCGIAADKPHPPPNSPRSAPRTAPRQAVHSPAGPRRRSRSQTRARSSSPAPAKCTSRRVSAPHRTAPGQPAHTLHIRQPRTAAAPARSRRMPAPRPAAWAAAGRRAAGQRSAARTRQKTGTARVKRFAGRAPCPGKAPGSGLRHGQHKHPKG